MKKKMKKLKLHRETVRALTQTHLEDAMGGWGEGGGGMSNPPPCNTYTCGACSDSCNPCI